MTTNGLIGKYFHSKDDDGETKWQGRIEERLTDEYYLVQLFSWNDGDPTHQAVVSITDMWQQEWAIFPNNEAMLAAFGVE